MYRLLKGVKTSPVSVSDVIWLLVTFTIIVFIVMLLFFGDDIVMGF